MAYNFKQAILFLTLAAAVLLASAHPRSDDDEYTNSRYGRSTDSSSSSSRSRSRSEGEEGAVTTIFMNLTRFEFLVNDFMFRSSVAAAVNAFSSGKKRQATMVTPDDVIYIEPCPCQDGNDLNVVFFVREDGTVVSRAVVSGAMDTAGDDIATQIGADAYGGTSAGTSGIPYNDDDDDDELSGGEIAAIVIVILVVIIAVLAVALVGVLVLWWRGSYSASHNGAEKVPLDSEPGYEQPKRPL